MKNSVEPPWARTNPNEIYRGGRRKNLPRLLERQRRASKIWTNQVDAAANGDAEERIDGGGWAREQRVVRNKTKTKRLRGEVKRTPDPIYKANG